MGGIALAAGVEKSEGLVYGITPLLSPRWYLRPIKPAGLHPGRYITPLTPVQSGSARASFHHTAASTLDPSVQIALSLSFHLFTVLKASSSPFTMRPGKLLNHPTAACSPLVAGAKEGRCPESAGESRASARHDVLWASLSLRSSQQALGEPSLSVV